MRPGWAAWTVPAAALALALGLGGCQERDRGRQQGRLVAGGDARTGQALVSEFGCSTCHVVPGVRGARGMVGPPLTDWARRRYIAGRLPNTPENLVRWIHDPPAVDSATAMPKVGATLDQARHLAAYLFTLR